MAMTFRPVTGTTVEMLYPVTPADGAIQRKTTHTHAAGVTVVMETFAPGGPPLVQVTYTP